MGVFILLVVLFVVVCLVASFVSQARKGFNQRRRR